MNANKSFGRMARWTSKAAGSPVAAATAVVLILVWAATGPIFHFSEDWQMVVNTGTTIVTFLMVFFIQHSQNCDSASLHIKLDELIRSNKDSDNKMIDLDSLDHDELEKLREAFSRIAVDAEDPAVSEVAQGAIENLTEKSAHAALAPATVNARAPSPIDPVLREIDAQREL